MNVNYMNEGRNPFGNYNKPLTKKDIKKDVEKLTKDSMLNAIRPEIAKALGKNIKILFDVRKIYDNNNAYHLIFDDKSLYDHKRRNPAQVFSLRLTTSGNVEIRIPVITVDGIFYIDGINPLMWPRMLEDILNERHKNIIAGVGNRFVVKLDFDIRNKLKSYNFTKVILKNINDVDIIREHFDLFLQSTMVIKTHQLCLVDSFTYSSNLDELSFLEKYFISANLSITWKNDPNLLTSLNGVRKYLTGKGKKVVTLVSNEDKANTQLKDEFFINELNLTRREVLKKYSKRMVSWITVGLDIVKVEFNLKDNKLERIVIR